MEQILIKNTYLPDWSLKEFDKDVFKSLQNSVHSLGQTKNIIVRAMPDNKYEVIDGKQVFKILKQLDKDYIWAHVYRDVDDLEAIWLYLQHDFYFNTNFVAASKAIEKLHKKLTKLEISKKTKYEYQEVIELLSLAVYDFSKFSKKMEVKNTKLF